MKYANDLNELLQAATKSCEEGQITRDTEALIGTICAGIAMIISVLEENKK